MQNFLSVINENGRSSKLLKDIFIYWLNNGASSIPSIAKHLNHNFPAITKHIVDLCAQGYLMQPIKTSINRHSLTLVKKDTQIVFSELKHKAGIIGGCMMARDKILKDSFY